jgi:hypothetical protein
MLHGTPEPGLSCARASIDPVNLSICAGGGFALKDRLAGVFAAMPLRPSRTIL